VTRTSEELRERSQRHQRIIPIFRKVGSVVEGSDAFVRDHDSEKVMDALGLIADVVEAAENDPLQARSVKRALTALREHLERQ
jgi:hypothetical protein